VTAHTNLWRAGGPPFRKERTVRTDFHHVVVRRP
jgi:hypothetical protein